jgi:minor extracellular serine protease Vpr
MKAIIPFVSFSFACLSLLVQAQMQAPQPSAETRSLAAEKINNSKMALVFVELDSSSVTEMVADHMESDEEMPPKDMQMDYAKQLSKKQKVLMEQLKGYGARHVANLRVSANGIKCFVHEDRIEEIAQLPNVKRVTKVTPKKKQQVFQNSQSQPLVLTKNNSLTDGNYDGSGIVIAVLDDGVNYYLDAFGGKYNKDTINQIVDDGLTIEPGTFPTDKVIGGIDLVGKEYEFSQTEEGSFLITTPDPDPYNPNPIDEGFSHGTSASGIAAGLAVADKILPGVAPGAKILAVKIFGDEGDLTFSIVEGIEYALDPNGDGAIDDKVDVINMSIAGAYGEKIDVDSIAAQNAVDLGVVVVVAGGNDSHRPYIAGTPSVADGVISVGAVQGENFNENDRTAKNFFIDIETDLVVKKIPTRLAAFNFVRAPISGNLVVANPINACKPLEGDYEGKIVLFRYERCPDNLNAFDAGTQINHLKTSKALASVLIEPDNSFGLTSELRDSFFVMGVQPFFGQPLLQDLISGKNIKVTIKRENQLIDTLDDFTIAPFSSRGPGIIGNTSFKPDISAVGVDVASAGSPNLVSGTSFSAPYVAGAAALLLQKNPSLSPEEVKAIFLNTANPSREINLPNGPYTPLSLQGVGILDIGSALATTSLVMPAGLGFGYNKLTKFQKLERTVTLKNLSNQSRVFNVSVESAYQNPGIRVIKPNTVFVGPNQSKDVPIRILVYPNNLLADVNSQKLIEADGWVIFEDGIDFLRVGYSLFVEPASDVQLLEAGTNPNNRFNILLNKGPSPTYVDTFSAMNIEELDEGALANNPFTYPVRGGFRVTPSGTGAVLSMLFMTKDALPSFFAGNQDTEKFVHLELYNNPFVQDLRTRDITDLIDPVVVVDDRIIFSPRKGDFIEGVRVHNDFNSNWFRLDINISDPTILTRPDSTFGFFFQVSRGLVVFEMPQSQLGKSEYDSFVMRPYSTKKIPAPSENNIPGFWFIRNNSMDTLIREMKSN